MLRTVVPRACATFISRGKFVFPSNYIYVRQFSAPSLKMALSESQAKQAPEMAQANFEDVNHFDIDTSAVGFIGLGNMGARITNNLCAKGYKVYGYDVFQAALDKAAANGVQACKSIAEVAKKSTVILTSVPEAKHLKGVLLGAEGVFANAKQGTYICDLSTIGYHAAVELATEAAKQGHSFMDTPVTGGVAGAEAGTLTFMISGSEHQYNEIQKLYSDIGKTFFHCGGPGMGSVAKIANNMILGMNMIGVCEALQLAESFGIDMKILTNVLNNGSARGYCVSVMHPIPGYPSVPNAPPDNDYKGGFAVDLIKKDMNIGVDAALKMGMKTPYTSRAVQEYDELSRRGYGTLDFTSQYKYGGAKLN